MSNAAKTIPMATMTKPATPAANPVQDSRSAPAASRQPTIVRAVYIALLALVLAAPVIGLYPVFVMKLLCFALFACAFNLLLGFTGLLSFGHAAFFGMGAYAAGWLIKSAGWPPEVGIVAGAGIGAVLGLLFGLVAIRRQGIYFAMITLAMAQMVFFFCLQAKFTGGEDGLQGVPRGTLFGVLPLESDITMYYVVAAIFIACFLGIGRIVTSPSGQVLKMIRENEPRAISLGYEVDRYKLLAFVLSSGLAGLAGSLKTLVMGFATLSDVHWSMSGEVILMSLLGGVGTFFGPVFGAGVVVALQDILSDKVGAWVTVIIGAIFVVCVLAFRKGVVGELNAWMERRRMKP
jgi:branched-chain amino acid transport system permease protein